MNRTSVTGLKSLLNKTQSCYMFEKPNNSKIDLIFKSIYQQLIVAHNKVSIISDPILKEIDTYHKLSNFSQINSSFVNDTIKEYIKSNIVYEIIYKRILSSGQTVIIYFAIPDISKSIEFSNYINKYVKIIFTWLEFIYPYSQKKCANKLEIFIYLTPFEKKLPENGDIIGPNHVNTAYTTSCNSDGFIIIYRNEEWFKVLIHECFHILGLDFSGNIKREYVDELRNFFPINSDYNLYEAYTETWAEILNCCFLAFNNTDNIQDFTSNVHYYLYIESVFSLFQLVKILNYMNLNYEDLYSMDEASVNKRLYFYKEGSNVFSYYIATSIFLFFHTKFLLWCNDNNINLIQFSKKLSTQLAFIDFLKKLYRNKEFTDAEKCINNIYKKFTKDSKCDDLCRTLRMSSLNLI